MKKTQTKPTKNQEELIFVTEEFGEIVVKLNKPTWEISVEAFKYLTDENEKIDLMTPGKLVFDFCATEYSPIIDDNVQLMMSICSSISSRYILPIQASIKEEKKSGN